MFPYQAWITAVENHTRFAGPSNLSRTLAVGFRVASKMAQEGKVPKRRTAMQACRHADATHKLCCQAVSDTPLEKIGAIIHLPAACLSVTLAW